MEAAPTGDYRPIGFWAPRSAWNVALRPRLWHRLLHTPVSVRIDPHRDRRHATLVRCSRVPGRHGGRLCLAFGSHDCFEGLAHRWRAVADAIGRLVARQPRLTFDEILIDVSDCGDASVPRETLRFARLPGDPHDLIPNAQLLGRRRRFPPALSWESKTDTVYFRGSLTGEVQSLENPRVAACLLGREYPTTFDCKLTQFPQTSAAFQADLERLGVVGLPESFTSLNRHRYLLDIDGNTSSWDRFWMIGMFGAVPIRFETRWEESWHVAIRDGEHFVSATRDTLVDVVGALRADPARARAITVAAAAVVRDILSPAAVQRGFEETWLRRVDTLSPVRS
jgi:hypothetical protein